MTSPENPLRASTPPQTTNPAAASSLETAEIKALAEVAGGIAPALNSYLGIVVGQTNQLLDSTALEPADRESLHQVYTAAERAVGLIRQLLLFSGRHPFHPGTLDLGRTIEAFAPVLRRLAGNEIEIEVRVGTSLPFVTADEAMLEQALLGLAWNARDAMPQGGRVVVAATTLIIGPHDLPAYPDGRVGTFVALSVEDTGTGISPDVLPRIFAPFFTTRSSGVSIGLGLPTVLGIVRQHQGWITVDSKVGTGSRFTIFLPAAPANAPRDSAPPSKAASGGGTETILLVDDEPLIRDFTAAILRGLGYRVLQTSSANEAVEAWKWHRDRIELLVIDVVLPGAASGPELANRFHAEKPNLAVILVSGHDRSILRRTAAVPASFQFLQKPWRPQTLTRVVRLMLDSRPR